ncbi:hypothetical protein AAHE18_12G037300 [Arachis hypogaea]
MFQSSWKLVCCLLFKISTLSLGYARRSGFKLPTLLKTVWRRFIDRSSDWMNLT